MNAHIYNTACVLYYGRLALLPAKSYQILNVCVSDCPVNTSPNKMSIFASQKGDFVMEKKEVCSAPDKFVIWKIDAGKLIQKYEPSTAPDGSVTHKSISTVSCLHSR